jgi:hypothetical protein
MGAGATQQSIHRFRNDSIRASLNHLWRWSSRVAFQRRKPAAMGVKAPLPGFIEPALASSIEKVPSGSRWIHEIKFDGYRVQIHLANEAVKIFTRRGTSAAARATISSTRVRWITASTRSPSPTCRRTEAADPQDAALFEEDRPQGHLGRAEASGRDRVPR